MTPSSIEMCIFFVLCKGVATLMSSQSPYDPSSSQTPSAQYTEYASQPVQPAYVPVNPYGQPAYSYPYMLQAEKGRGLALAGMILGIISMITWLLPILGYPTAIVGLILSIIGRRSVSRKGMAITGIILSSIALVLTLCNSALGVYLAIHR